MVYSSRGERYWLYNHHEMLAEMKNELDEGHNYLSPSVEMECGSNVNKKGGIRRDLGFSL